MDQIEALISISEFCEQKVENNCTSNQLTGFSWWLDRNGNKFQYWHGEGSNTTLGRGSYFIKSAELDYIMYEGYKT